MALLKDTFLGEKVHLYKFPLKYLAADPYQQYHIIDLDYIVGIGPVNPVSYSGNSFGEAHAYFDVFIKIGQPVRITINSGSTLKCPDSLVAYFQVEREKLIEAWEISGMPREDLPLYLEHVKFEENKELLVERLKGAKFSN